MIPILYEANETDFTSNGIGRLSDAISCKVIEERNGVYELEMEYHIDGIHYKDISKDRLIIAKPFDGGTNQVFRIYNISKPINGVVTVFCEHISYLLNRMGVSPFTAGSCAEAFSKIESNFVASCPFTFWTDKEVTANMNVVEPHNARELLGGMQGSILDVYGKGDYEFDNFVVKFHSNRGSDNGVTLRYGKNLSSMTNNNDIQNAYTAIVPFWKDSEDNVFMLPEKVVWSSHRNDYYYPLIKIVDFSSDFDEKPTEKQLRSKANSYLSKNSGWEPTANLQVSFVALWQTEEYESIANLERVKMCDSVTVVYDRLGVNAKMRVIKTDYDVLKERYNSIELGEASSNISKAVAETDKNLNDTATQITSGYKKAVAHATKMIQGGLGGHIVFNTDAQGHPNELLIMDTDDRLTAVNVWRFNLGGLGHSHSGYDGPFDDIALTADGQINATMITTGFMKATRIQSGILQSDNKNLIFNLETGKMTVKGANGLTIEAANGLIVKAGNFQINSHGDVTITGAITANSGRIGGANGFVIGSKKLYNGKSSFDSTAAGICIDIDHGISLGSFKGGSDGTGFRVTNGGRVEAGCLYLYTGSGTTTARYGLWAKDRTHIGSGGPCDFNSENDGWNYLRNKTETGLLDVRGQLSVYGDMYFKDGNYNIHDVDEINGNGKITMDSAKFPGGVNSGGCNLVADLKDDIKSLSDRISALGG